MIVGGYDLHLYCRHEKLHAERDGKYGSKSGFAEFHGYNKNDAYGDARKAGWKFSNFDVTCPGCIKDDVK